MPLPASLPTATLACPSVFSFKDCLPIATFRSPFVLESGFLTYCNIPSPLYLKLARIDQLPFPFPSTLLAKACFPIATLYVPSVLFAIAPSPIAVLSLPLVVFTKVHLLYQYFSVVMDLRRLTSYLVYLQ